MITALVCEQVGGQRRGGGRRAGGEDGGFSGVATLGGAEVMQGSKVEQRKAGD